MILIQVIEFLAFIFSLALFTEVNNKGRVIRFFRSLYFGCFLLAMICAVFQYNGILNILSALAMIAAIVILSAISYHQLSAWKKTMYLTICLSLLSQLCYWING